MLTWMPRLEPHEKHLNPDKTKGHQLTALLIYFDEVIT